MSYLTTKHYSLDRPVLYNNVNTNNLFNSYIKPENLSLVGGYKKIPAGSWLAEGDRPLDRAIVISPYTAGETKLKVNNPWAFLPGDVLHIIGDATNNAIAERNAVDNATAPILGTVTSVDAGSSPMITTITPSAVAVDDIFKLKIEEIEVSFTATTTNVADVTKGLYDQLVTYHMQSDHSTLEAINITDNGTDLTITAKEPGLIFMATGQVVGSGGLAIAVADGIGTLNISLGAGNANLDIGAKIGSIDKKTLGIIASTMYLTDSDNLDRTADCAPYDMANIYCHAMIYLDGSLVNNHPTLKFIPSY